MRPPSECLDETEAELDYTLRQLPRNIHGRHRISGMANGTADRVTASRRIALLALDRLAESLRMARRWIVDYSTMRGREAEAELMRARADELEERIGEARVEVERIVTKAAGGRVSW